jgi:uncharacterized protein YyaL (SSP411 family)
MSIPWLPWSAAAFAQAREASRPVLLYISTAWCRWCAEMERTTWAESSVQKLVEERFVPVRVDADRRPDVFDRYTLGGVPTTAFLTGDGFAFGGGTYVAAQRMTGALEQAAGAFASRRAEIDRRALELESAAEEPGTILSPGELTARVFDSYDTEHGGFGRGPKFPLTAPLHLALALSGSSASPFRAMLEQTLDAMAGGALYDDAEGGFFRCAADRDWRNASEEKLLDVNAALLRLYADAADVLDAARYREIAADILRFVQTALADPVDGGWAGSRRGETVDRTLYTGWNAQMVSAALRAARLFDDHALAQFAVTSLERVLLASYRPGAGVAHYDDPSTVLRAGPPTALTAGAAAQVRGLLDDQIHTAAAALDAFEATGNIVYSMMAEELGHYVLRTMWDDDKAGFFDRVDADEEVGLLRRRAKPFVPNCEAASVMGRLAAASGTHEFREKAEAALARAAGMAPAHGPLGAHYLLAMRDCGLR